MGGPLIARPPCFGRIVKIRLKILRARSFAPLENAGLQDDVV
jgi:hypothetical protein